MVRAAVVVRPSKNKVEASVTSCYRLGHPTWMLLHEGESVLSTGDNPMWDDPAARQKAMDWVGAFTGREFPRMNEVIVKRLQEYETQQTSASVV